MRELTAHSDGMGVGVMLEVARVLIERNEPINGSVIFSMSIIRIFLLDEVCGLSADAKRIEGSAWRS